MRARWFFWGAVLGTSVYPLTQIITHFVLGRTLLHPDH